MGSGGLTAPEVRLKRALQAFAFMSLGYVGGYVVAVVVNHAEFPFVANSIAKDMFFVALAAIAATDVRRYGWATLLVIGGHVVLFTTLAILGLAQETKHLEGTVGDLPLIGPEELIWIWCAVAFGVAVVFTVLYDRAQRARFGLRYLGHAEFATLCALAEILVKGEHELVEPERIAKNVDDYLASFEARGKWRVRLALIGLTVWPLLTLRAPYPLMPPDRREAYVKRRFLARVGERRGLRPVRTVVQSMIRAAQQMVYLGYYSDPRAKAAAGYRTFEQRGLPTVPVSRAKLQTRSARQIDADVMNADVVVIGSGAAGAIAAYRLAQAGRSVLVLERGRHVDPTEFTDNEAHQLSTLYNDGALQLSRDFRFQVVQGMCVGGSTVVNNAVCLPPPMSVLERWSDRDGFDARLEPADVLRAAEDVQRFLPATRMKENLNPSGKLFLAGVEKLGLAGSEVVECNIEGCLGCGWCNYGCRYGAKLSMLDNVLPRAQQDFGPEALRIVAECRVHRISTSGRRATSVDCRLPGGRKLEVRANDVVVAAGALHSSTLLRRSRIGGSRVGTGISFNMGSPLTAWFPQQVRATEGLQISHVLLPRDMRNAALEVWFNPVVAQSLFMPGWFEQHYENMLQYDRSMCVGTVVGTEPNGTVKPQLFGPQPVLDFTPTRDELGRLVDGLKLAGRIMLEAGAERVSCSTFVYREFRDAAELDGLDTLVQDSGDVSVNSAHPQGGNRIGADRTASVVDPDFKVHGYENLYVCDASVFPSSVTVNPQLTVMALAWLAANRIAGRELPYPDSAPGATDVALQQLLT